MSRLWRPTIPVEIKCQVALLQLGEMFPDDVIKANPRRLSRLLLDLKDRIADLLRCAVSDLRLDHDPPLGARRKIMRQGKIVEYEPKANDPNHLRYRPHGPEFHHSHLIKTNVRGEHGQHPDRVLIKKARRLEKIEAARAAAPKQNSALLLPTPKMARKKTQNGKNGGTVGMGRGRLRSANRWPPPGSRKIANRRKLGHP